MTDEEIRKIQILLKETFPPLPNAELQRDLWPNMQERMNRPAIRLAWWDWALLTAVTTVILLFPTMIPALLYHL
jgi:hypothetical protein